MNFHEVRFPTAISFGATGGPERRTDIVALGSGYEERNTRWAGSRRTYNAGYGVRAIEDLYDIIAFFEERRGRLYGFRWRDPLDWKSSSPDAAPAPLDQVLGVGDGSAANFPLVKQYGRDHAPWHREIKKPVAGSVVVAVDGVLQSEGTDFLVDPADGVVRFVPGSVPPQSSTVTAGFAFDVPVRFDTDKLDVSLRGFHHGAIPSIPIVEVRL